MLSRDGPKKANARRFAPTGGGKPRPYEGNGTQAEACATC